MRNSTTKYRLSPISLKYYPHPQGVQTIRNKHKIKIKYINQLTLISQCRRVCKCVPFGGQNWQNSSSCLSQLQSQVDQDKIQLPEQL